MKEEKIVQISILLYGDKSLAHNSKFSDEEDAYARNPIHLSQEEALKHNSVR